MHAPPTRLKLLISLLQLTVFVTISDLRMVFKVAISYEDAVSLVKQFLYCYEDAVFLIKQCKWCLKSLYCYKDAVSITSKTVLWQHFYTMSKFLNECFHNNNMNIKFNRSKYKCWLLVRLCLVHTHTYTAFFGNKERAE